MLNSYFRELKLSSPELGYDVDMRNETLIIDAKSHCQSVNILHLILK